MVLKSVGGADNSNHYEWSCYNSGMIITLTGSNNFAIDQDLTTLARQFQASHGEHSIEKVDGEICSPSRLPDLLTGATLFAADRMVVMRNVSQNKLLWEALSDWLPKVPNETTLIIVEPLPDKRTKTFKSLKKLSDFRGYAELSEAELIPWLQKVTTKLGGNIDAKTAKFLVQSVGAKQEQLWQELQKLVSYQSQITAQTVDILVEPTLSVNVFELLDSSLGGKPKKMQAILMRLRNNEDPYKIFGLLVSQLYTAAVVASTRQKDTDIIAKEASLHPYVVRKTQVLAINQDKTRKLVGLVAELDNRLKSGSADPWLLLEQCLNKISIL